LRFALCAFRIALCARGFVPRRFLRFLCSSSTGAAVAGAFLAAGLYPFEEAAYPAPAEGVGVLAALVAELCWTFAVYWVGPALGAVLGTGLFKAAYKGESKKKSKRKTR